MVKWLTSCPISTGATSCLVNDSWSQVLGSKLNQEWRLGEKLQQQYQTNKLSTEDKIIGFGYPAV